MPRRFQSGGGYTGYCTYPVDAQEQVRPPLTPRYKQQQIAQKMVSSDYNQERSASSPIGNQDHYFHIGTADDVAEGDLIPPWKAKPNNSREMYVKRCAERSMLRRQGEMRPISVDVDENYGMHNVEDEQHASESPQLPPPPQPQSPPASTKSVSFNTRDKIHQWDDQLDELKHVDEVFFAAAKYLLEDVHNVANDYLEMEEKDFDLVQSFHGDPEGAAGKGGTVSDGIFAKLFQCGDLSGANESAKPYLGIDGEILDDGQVTHQPRKQFRLREKLLNDFQAALDYRLTKLDEDENGTIDDDIALQTREIARKIDAYGLPKLWRNECQEEEDPNGAKPSTGSLVKPRQLEKSPQRHADTHFFPLLPTENDEGEAEVGTAFKSTKIENSSNLLSFFSSIFKSKTTPTEEQCEKNLQRIGHEIQKAHQMKKMTHNTSVQSACAHQIAKLNYEKRFYQIIKEQYKIRQMQQTTRMGSVKFACQERLKQLLLELESLRVDEDIVNDDARESWLDRAKQYVNATCDVQPSLRNAEQMYQTHENTFHSDWGDLQYPQQQRHQDYGSQFVERNHYSYPQDAGNMHNPNFPIHIHQQQRQTVQHSGKSNMQPRRVQRLPLAKPLPKNEGLNNFISYIAPS